MNKEVIKWIDSIILNDLIPYQEKLYQIGIILSYAIDDSKLRDEYYEYYDNLIWSRIELVEIFDYDNNNYIQTFLEEDGYNWEEK
jgi:hypothetical protein